MFLSGDSLTIQLKPKNRDERPVAVAVPGAGSGNVHCCRFPIVATSGTDESPVTMLMEDYQSYFCGVLSLCRHSELHHFPVDTHTEIHVEPWCEGAYVTRGSGVP